MSWLWIAIFAVVAYVAYTYFSRDHFTLSRPEYVYIGAGLFGVLILAVYFAVLRRE
jgi:hypothetical protein